MAQSHPRVRGDTPSMVRQSQSFFLAIHKIAAAHPTSQYRSLPWKKVGQSYPPWVYSILKQPLC